MDRKRLAELFDSIAILAIEARVSLEKDSDEIATEIAWDRLSDISEDVKKLDVELPKA